MAAQVNQRLGAALSRKNWESQRSNSTTSSIGSAKESMFGSFDPENEAIASTQPIDSAVFTTAKSQRSVNAKGTNAIYFDSESGSEASVEVGRGIQGHKIMDDSRNDDTMDSSDAMIGDFKVMYSPSGPARRVSKGKSTNPQNLRQSAQIRLASMASQKENLDPAPHSKTRPTENAAKIRRRTLGEINARAAELYDGSLMTDERPVQATPAKTTRFTHPSRVPSNLGPVYATNTVTQTAESNPSFLLPDLPNISQLVSGNRGNSAWRPKPTHPALLQTPRGPMHKTVNNVPLPEDEQAIFLSLQLLQRKVSELEATNCEFQQMVEDLKVTNKILRKEKKELKVQNEELRLENEGFRTDHVSKLHRPEEVLSQRQRQQAAALDQVNTKVSQLQKGRQEEDLFSLTPTESIKLRSKAAASHGPKADNSPDKAAGSKRTKRVVIDEDESFVLRGKDVGEDLSEGGNITYITTQPASDFLSNLRNEMEAERLEAKKCKDGLRTDAVRNSTLPRKSSMKDLSQRISADDVAAATRAKFQADKPGPSITFDPDLSQDMTDQISRPLSDAARRHSDPTVTAASNTSRRRRASSNYDENMTSAFIIPDITIAQPAPIPNIDPAAQNVIHTTCPHDTRNCTICTRLLAPNKPSSRKTISVPLPVPVSSQVMEASADNPDPTVRPSQPPHIALAIVLKELTDQHTHLKLALRQKQAEYDALDPRLGRRRREAVGREVREGVDRCERVAGLVYRLCDVLEGVKGGAAEEMELEVTVQEMRDVLGVYGREDEGDREDEGF